MVEKNIKITGAKNYQKGFGLLEVVITAAIVVVVLGCLVAIGRAAENGSERTQERAMATYMAQGALEQVRQIRDSNWIDGDNTTQWNDWVCSTSNLPGYSIPMCDKGIVVPTLGADYEFAGVRLAPLYNQTRTFLLPTSYYSGGCVNQAPNFSGACPIVNVVSVGNLLPNIVSNAATSTDLALKVTATVGWMESGQAESVSVSEILTNWRPNF